MTDKLGTPEGIDKAAAEMERVRIAHSKQEQEYKPLSEAELVECITCGLMMQPGAHKDKWHCIYALKATIRDLQGQVSAYEGTYQHKCREQLKQVLEEVTLLKASIAKVMDAYAAAPGRAITYDRFKDIMADTIVRG